MHIMSSYYSYMRTFWVYIMRIQTAWWTTSGARTLRAHDFIYIYCTHKFIIYIYICIPVAPACLARLRLTFFSFKSYTRFVVTKRARLLSRAAVIITQHACTTRMYICYTHTVIHIYIYKYNTCITFHNNWVYYTSCDLYNTYTCFLSVYIGHFVNRFSYTQSHRRLWWPLRWDFWLYVYNIRPTQL